MDKSQLEQKYAQLIFQYGKIQLGLKELEANAAIVLKEIQKIYSSLLELSKAEAQEKAQKVSEELVTKEASDSELGRS